MSEEFTPPGHVLRRLASLKMDKELKEPLLSRSNSENYESIQNNGNRFKKAVDSVQNIIKKWKAKTASNQLLHKEQRMRRKLEYHFLTPFEKYKRGRKPWKLAIQILKIIIVTIQVGIFPISMHPCSTYMKIRNNFKHFCFVM